MNVDQILAPMIGQLTIANAKQAVTIATLQRELAEARKEIEKLTTKLEIAHGELAVLTVRAEKNSASEKRNGQALAHS